MAEIDLTTDKGPRGMDKPRRLLQVLTLLCLLLVPVSVSAKDEAADQPRDPVKLPGLVVDFQKRCVDIEAKVSLDEGLLEVVACIADTKEHEALVVIKSVPSHVHAALLLLGVKNGHPYLVKQVEEEGEKRFIHLPPRGDRVAVSLVYQDADGNEVERSVSDFIKRSQESLPDAKKADEEEKEADRFPDTFLFAGSQVLPDQNGERQYLADESGHVITISTFGDDVLCLPTHQSSDNSALVWEVDAEHLPKVGKLVTLRLRPKANKNADEGADE